MKMSYVRCHASGVRCQLSDVTYHLRQQPQPQPQTLPLLNIPTRQKQNKKQKNYNIQTHIDSWLSEGTWWNTFIASLAMDQLPDYDYLKQRQV